MDIDPIQFLTQARLAGEYTQFITEEFVEVMIQRGHRVEFFGDEILVESV